MSIFSLTAGASSLTSPPNLVDGTDGKEAEEVLAEVGSSIGT